MAGNSRRRAALAGTLGGLLAQTVPAAAAVAGAPGAVGASGTPGASGTTGAPVAAPAAPAEPLSTLTGTLRAYVDTLIPADETPAGSALGADRALLANGSQRDYRRLLELGLTWIDRAALAAHGRRFHTLDEAARDAIVGRAAAADPGSMPRVFFERTRADAFFHYYGQPAGWRGLAGYTGPPQPRGFPDFASAPRAKR